jgi:hypothetical protein
MTVIAWSCTKGRFRWHYDVDEMAHILAGEVFITDESGTERRLGAGDTVFFAAGSTCIWQVTQDIRKVAVCHAAVPKLVGLGLRVWNKLRRIASEILGLDDGPAASGSGSMAAGPMGSQHMSAPRSHSAATAPPA